MRVSRSFLTRCLSLYKWHVFVKAMVIVFTLSCFIKVEYLAAEVDGEQLRDSSSTSEIVPLEKRFKKIIKDPGALRFKYFYLERPTLGLTLSYESNNNKIVSPGNNSKDSDSEFMERLEVSTRGWVYHPALMEFVLDLEPELKQMEVDGNYMQSDSVNEFIASYSLGLTLLPQKTYSLYLYGRKYQNSFMSAFADRADLELDTYGADLKVKNIIAPLTLSYSNTKSKREGLLLSSEEQDNVSLTVNYPTMNSITKLNMDYSDNQRNSEGVTTQVEKYYNHLESTYFMDKNLMKKVLSSLLYDWTSNWQLDDSGTYTSSYLRWYEQLYWTHSRNLQTNYTFQYNVNKTNKSEVEKTIASATLKHLLYENLQTSLKGKTSRYDYVSGENNLLEGGLALDYNRRIPWGTLNITTGLNGFATDRGAGSSVWVTNEKHRLTSGSASFLVNDNVEIDSIRVTNKAGTVLYVRDQDYTLTKANNLVRISRLFSGNIKEGEQVLVSYRHSSDGGYDDLIIGHNGGISLLFWSTLRLSYDYNHRSQNVISGIEPDSLIDDTVQRAKASLIWNWTDTSLSYEDYDMNKGSARTTWRLNEWMTFEPTNQLSLHMSGYVGSTSFKDLDRQEDFIGFSSKIHWRPSYWCKTGLEAYQDGISGDSEDVVNRGFHTFVEMYYGKWIFNVKYRYLDHDDLNRDSQRIRQNIMLKITRTLW